MPFQALQSTVISRLELVLPKNVLQTCITLQKGFAAEFLSTNLAKRTTSTIKVAKQNDESVRLIVSVSRIEKENPQRPEHVLIHGMKDKVEPKDGAIAPQDVRQNNESRCLEIATKPHQSPVQLLCSEEETHLLKSVDKGNEDQQTDTIGKGLDTLEETAESALVEYQFPDSNKLQLIDSDNRESSLNTACDIDMDLVALPELIENQADSEILGSLNDSVLGKTLEGWDSKVSKDEVTLLSTKSQARTPHKECDAEKELEPYSSKGAENSNINMTHYPEVIDAAVEQNLPSEQLEEDRTNENRVVSEVESQGSGFVLDAINQSCVERRTENEGVKRFLPQTADRSHMKRPNYKREQNIPCKFCKAKLKDEASLFEHAKLKHSNAKGYSEFAGKLRDSMKVTCELCGQVYSRKEQLAIHMDVIHSESSGVDCSKCGLHVKSNRHLKDHIRRIHGNTGRSHLCHLCPASFKLPSYLAAHLKYLHTKNKPDAYPCEECNKTYKSEKYLRNHKMRVHGAKRHVCGYCCKGFTTYPNMQRHVQLMHEKKGDKPFVCDVCGRGFSLKANLKDHANALHRNIYSMHCSACGLGFRRKKDLQTHEMNAHGIPVRTTTVIADQADPSIRIQSLSENQTMSPTVIQSPAQAQSSDVQYIMATPEILKVFGIQLNPEIPQSVMATDAEVCTESTSDLPMCAD